MSIMLRLGINMSKLPNLLEQYTEDLSTYADNLVISGKTLEKSLREQATWSAFYGERAVELGIIVKHLEAQVKKVRGRLSAQYNENYNPALSERMTDKYIDKEDDYLDTYEMLLEVQELYEKYKMVLDAFNRRGFALRDITSARIAEIHQVTL